METFSENSLWTNVVKPFNTDYHIAEQSNFSLSTANPFLVGDYVVETATNASGIVYEILSSTSINVARDSSTLFPSGSGSIGNGTATVSYTLVTTTHGISNKVSQDLVDRTKWLYDNKAGSNINITVGVGLTGGGNLTASRTISMGTPNTITSSTTNTASGTTHTHAISSASTTQSGVVQLNNTLTSTSTTQALTAAQGKILQDGKAANTIDIAAGVGLTGGGNLTASRTVSMGVPSTLNGNTTNAVAGTTHTHAISASTESLRGIVELATSAETTAGTDNTRAVHPAGLKVELDKKSAKTTSISAGVGLTGGGDLSTNRIISMGTPSIINDWSGNTVSGTTHTHEVAKGSIYQAGIVSLIDHLGSWSTTQALTANMGRHLDASKAWNGIDIGAGGGLTGGGNLTTHRTISMGTPSTLNGYTGNAVSGTTHTHAISAATDYLPGIVELATVAEVVAGTDNTRAVTPYGLAGQKSLSGNGWYKFPGGLIIQWGYVNVSFTNTNRDFSVVFPINHPSSCLLVQLTLYGGSLVNNTMNIGCYSKTNSSFVLRTYSNNTFSNNVLWFSIGY